ncbi:helix-turn-helix domain-containing protein [Streptomyces scopuliridis]|uniref:HTH cro/C1-type domain-containing protein n=1 Tax=Streptomyces scopuliridis RB72 TaxID=1440053 RepID=A0A2T7SNY4_9ACTN|nr:helix-turn-helix transcriptional regulator [Streptomyces scopuliridis]PVE04642.1 hypothetical protein Y717_10630 [Streptomyces scopuliridis RB72]
MKEPRLRLIDPHVLRHLMQHAPDGRPISGKTLGDRVGLSKSKISALLHEERATVTPGTAERIATTLGVHTGALFFEPLSTPMGMDSRIGKDTP